MLLFSVRILAALRIQHLLFFALLNGNSIFITKAD